MRRSRRRGQVTVPKVVREALGIMEGDHVVFRVEGNRILHAGDTLWHGYWWRTAEEHWPVDTALRRSTWCWCRSHADRGPCVDDAGTDGGRMCGRGRWVRVGESDDPLARRTGDHA
ncbi:MAG: AbrB/MazE/SpoVT family DNA-binding domain-containing protein [Actinomycetota bacterium]|nr:AbrB/MazE/SpoVT family DNA-binding domain-containing protein [Actinomycetota bacterium]